MAFYSLKKTLQRQDVTIYYLYLFIVPPPLLPPSPILRHSRDIWRPNPRYVQYDRQYVINIYFTLHHGNCYRNLNSEILRRYEI